jgi:hypothetical protein
VLLQKRLDGRPDDLGRVEVDVMRAVHFGVREAERVRLLVRVKNLRDMKCWREINHFIKLKHDHYPGANPPTSNLATTYNGSVEVG